MRRPLIALVFASLLAAPTTWADPPVMPAVVATSTTKSDSSGIDASQLLKRVAFIGASATAGFGVIAIDPEGKKPLVPIPLSAAFAGALATPVEAVDFASPFFFMNPGASGLAQIDRALAMEPTLVVAIDFLFWYGYGDDDGKGGVLKSEDDRLAKLDIGITQLERFPATVPIVISDFPDMSRAVGKMLSRAQMPKPETLEKLNAKLKEWAASRKNVLQFSLSDLVEKLKSDDVVVIAGMEFKRDRGRLIQSDDLHPTFRGAIGLSLRVAETLRDRFGEALPMTIAKDEAAAQLHAREYGEAILAKRAKGGR